MDTPGGSENESRVTGIPTYDVSIATRLRPQAREDCQWTVSWPKISRVCFSVMFSLFALRPRGLGFLSLLMRTVVTRTCSRALPHCSQYTTEYISSHTFLLGRWLVAQLNWIRAAGWARSSLTAAVARTSQPWYQPWYHPWYTVAHLSHNLCCIHCNQLHQSAASTGCCNQINQPVESSGCSNHLQQLGAATREIKQLYPVVAATSCINQLHPLVAATR